jgi:2-phosphoglycerate kinase
VVDSVIQRCIAQNKPVLVICGVNKVPDEVFRAKYNSEKVHVLDLVSEFGEQKSLKHTAKCLEDLCQMDKFKSLFT